MFGTHKAKFYVCADSAVRQFGFYQETVFKTTGNLVIVTKVAMTSNLNTIIHYKTVKPKDGPEKELSEAQKHINNAKIMLGA